MPVSAFGQTWIRSRFSRRRAADPSGGGRPGSQDAPHRAWAARAWCADAEPRPRGPRRDRFSRLPRGAPGGGRARLRGAPDAPRGAPPPPCGCLGKSPWPLRCRCGDCLPVGLGTAFPWTWGCSFPWTRDCFPVDSRESSDCLKGTVTRIHGPPRCLFAAKDSQYRGDTWGDIWL